jgi:hypothetical protein
MNTKKLLRIISEILLNEKKYKFQNLFNQLLSYYQQNNPEGVNQTRDEIYDAIKQSPMSRYVNSDFKMLKGLEVY